MNAIVQRIPVSVANFIRFGFAGAVVTLLGVAIYWGAADLAGVPPLTANALAYVICLAIGYGLHSRWSFQTDERASMKVGVRYALVSLASVALNSIWVWLMVLELGGPVWLPIAPMVLVTPLVSFVLYRTWVFPPRREFEPVHTGLSATG